MWYLIVSIPDLCTLIYFGRPSLSCFGGGQVCAHHVCEGTILYHAYLLFILIDLIRSRSKNLFLFISVALALWHFYDGARTECPFLISDAINENEFPHLGVIVISIWTLGAYFGLVWVLAIPGNLRRNPWKYGNCSNISNTSCLPRRPRQTVQTQIRLLL